MGHSVLASVQEEEQKFIWITVGNTAALVKNTILINTDNIPRIGPKSIYILGISMKKGVKNVNQYIFMLIGVYIGQYFG